MTGGALPFEREFCIKWPTGAAAVLISAFTKLANTLFASQLLQWKTKLLTMFIN